MLRSTQPPLLLCFGAALLCASCSYKADPEPYLGGDDGANNAPNNLNSDNPNSDGPNSNNPNSNNPNSDGPNSDNNGVVPGCDRCAALDNAEVMSCEGECVYRCVNDRADANGDLGASGSDGCECLSNNELELCDGVDNDCDGLIDDDPSERPRCLGVCEAVSVACVLGDWQSCEQAAEAQPPQGYVGFGGLDTCPQGPVDLLDRNCDGEAGEHCCAQGSALRAFEPATPGHLARQGAVALLTSDSARFEDHQALALWEETDPDDEREEVLRGVRNAKLYAGVARPALGALEDVQALQQTTSVSAFSPTLSPSEGGVWGAWVESAALNDQPHLRYFPKGANPFSEEPSRLNCLARAQVKSVALGARPDGAALVAWTQPASLANATACPGIPHTPCGGEALIGDCVMGSVARPDGSPSAPQDLTNLLALGQDGRALVERGAPLVLATEEGWLVAWVQENEGSREVHWGFLGEAQENALVPRVLSAPLQALAHREAALTGAVMPQGLVLAYYPDEANRAALSLAWISLDGDAPSVRATRLALNEPSADSPLSLVALPGALGIVWSDANGRARLSRVAWRGAESLEQAAYLDNADAQWGLAPLGGAGFLAVAPASSTHEPPSSGPRLGAFDVEGVPACVAPSGGEE